MQKILDNFKNIPVALSGLALGIIGLGRLLATEIHPYFLIKALVIAVTLLLILVVKNLLHSKVFIAEVVHPVSGSLIPTFSMALMFVASSIGQYSLISGQILWYMAVILHVLFAVNFAYHRFHDFSINIVLPSYFVPFAGILAACFSGVSLELAINLRVIFYIGFVLYLSWLPLVLYRLFFGAKIPEDQLPTFAIMASPANLCLCSYLCVFEQPDYVFATMLFSLALFMNFLMLLLFIRINLYRLRFVPIYATMSFPLIISSTGLIEYSQFIGQIHIYFGEIWYVLGIAELIFAVVVIIWITFKMFKFVKESIFLF